jgi:tRNA(fMet)-specific endonuclease VapC
MACLDTSFLIDLHRRNTDLGQRASRKMVELAEHGETLVTSRLCLAELYVGIELARDRAREVHHLHQILRDLEILPFHDGAAWMFARSTAHLRRIGRPAGDMDVLIAATALAHGHCLVTRNPAHFAHIPHLKIETY